MDNVFDLTHKQCKPCEVGTLPLSQDEIITLLSNSMTGFNITS